MTSVVRRPLVQVYGVRLRIWPILLAAILIEPLLMLGREPARWIWHHGPADWADRPWVFIGLACVLQGVVGVMAILVMRRILPDLQDNLRWPPGRSLAGLAALLGIGMGLVMFLADYWPDLVQGTPPVRYATDPGNAIGWIVAVASAPLGEETIFRGLLIGSLAVLVPGRVRVGRLDLPLAAYIVALLFAAVHWRSFLQPSLSLAIAQQGYAIVWGLAYAWLMERSRSLLAPAIAHGMGDAVEVAMVIGWRMIG